MTEHHLLLFAIPQAAATTAELAKLHKSQVTILVIDEPGQAMDAEKQKVRHLMQVFECFVSPVYSVVYATARL